MPPLMFASKKDQTSSAAAAKPATRPLAGTMDATREAYIANLAKIRDAKKGGWPGFANHYLELDGKDGPFTAYPDGARMADVMGRIISLHAALMGEGAMEDLRAGEEDATGALHYSAGEVLTGRFLVQSIYEWPAGQWECLMKNAEMCAGNPRLDQLFIFYLHNVANSDGKLDYTAAMVKCAQDPHNAKNGQGTPEVLPLLPDGLKDNPPTAIVSQAALLEDYRQSYTHYAGIVCNGEPVSVAASPRNAYHTDGQEVFLPVSESHADTLEKNERSLFRGLNHECWHIRYHSFRFVLELIGSGLLGELGATLEKRPGIEPGPDGKVRDRIFLTRAQGKALSEPKEVASLLDLLEMFPEPHQPYAMDLLNIVEDGRIEFYGMNYFTGIRDEYEQDNIDTLHRRELVSKPKAGLAFGQVLEYLAQKTIVHATKNELTGNAIPPEIEERAKKAAGIFLSVQQNGMRAEDSFNATMAAYLDLKDIIEEFVKNNPEKRFIFKGWSETPGGSPGKIKICSDPQEAAGVKRRRGIGLPKPAHDDKPKPGRKDGRGEEGDASPSQSIITDPNKKGESPVSTRSGTYPEWDVNVNAYWPMFATVKEIEAQGAPIAPSPILLRQFEDELLFLKPRGWMKLRRQRSGVFDVQEFQKQYLDLKVTGREMRGDFYTKMKKETRSVAVALLVDGSGSTSTLLENGNNVLEEELAIASPFCHALKEIGDASALFVYNSSGQAETNFCICKDFGDEEIRGMQSKPGNNNRDGAAIRHATARLLERNEKTRVLIFFSDTQPADTGYNDAYAVADTAMAIREAEQAGITVFGISVSPYRDYMNKIYSADNFICIKSASDIRAHLARIFRYLAGEQA